VGGESGGDVVVDVHLLLAGDDGTVSAAEGQGKIASASSWIKREASLHLL
jgi:hypothetical protein